MNVRIIPRLDIKGPNLVKGIHLEGLRVLGRPEDFARHYYETGADELFYQDSVASLYGRNSLLEIVARTAREIFIPLCVGGGLRNLDDIRAVLRAGADKVALNTAVTKNPELIHQAARAFGSSTIVVAIEAIRGSDGRWLCYTDCGREETGVEATQWAQRAAEMGAGELLVTSVDREGTGKGFDLELTSAIATVVGIPVIAHGGAGKMEHIHRVISEGRADAVAMASMLHYGCYRQFAADGRDFSGEGNTMFIKAERIFTRMETAGIQDIKRYLSERDILCRWEGDGIPGVELYRQWCETVGEQVSK